jgi:hypothetical protein
MASRILWWGLLGPILAFGQAVSPPKTDKDLGDLLADLSRRLERSQEQANPLERRLERPKVCAAPLLEAKPNIQSRMPVIKPPQPLPRMPQLVPPAPPCPERRFTDRDETR